MSETKEKPIPLTSVEGMMIMQALLGKASPCKERHNPPIQFCDSAGMALDKSKVKGRHRLCRPLSCGTPFKGVGICSGYSSLKGSIIMGAIRLYSDCPHGRTVLRRQD